MIRQRQADRLATWLKQVKEDALGELKSFAAGLWRDYGAVRAGLSSAHSRDLFGNAFVFLNL
jgi:transposase